DLGAEAPRLLLVGLLVRVVGAHEREQDAGLHPAGVELGGGLAGEAADVGPAVGHAARGEAEAHLDREDEVLPRRDVVAGPGGGVALAAREAGAREQERAL